MLELRDPNVPVLMYGLVDPRNDELRYVGKTEGTLKGRLGGHFNEAKNKKGKISKNIVWLRSLRRKNLKPEIFELETVPFSEWRDAEVFWVAYFKSLGCWLNNHTAGGDGISGYHHTEESKKKMSKSQTGHGCSEETRAKMSIAGTGRKHTEESKAKISKKNKGKKRTAEQIEKMQSFEAGHTPWNKGKKMSAEFCEKARQRQLGKSGELAPNYGKLGNVRSDEANAQTSASLKEYYKHNSNPMQGKKHSDKTKHKMSASHKKR